MCAITLVCCFGSGELVASAVVFGAVVLTLVFSYRVYGLYRTAAREQKRAVTAAAKTADRLTAPAVEVADCGTMHWAVACQAPAVAAAAEAR